MDISKGSDILGKGAKKPLTRPANTVPDTTLPCLKTLSEYFYYLMCTIRVRFRYK